MGKIKTELEKAKERNQIDPIKRERQKGEFYEKIKKVDKALAEEFRDIFIGEWVMPMSEVMKNVEELRRCWLERRAMAEMVADIIETASEKTGWAEWLSERNKDLEDENKTLLEILKKKKK